MKHTHKLPRLYVTEALSAGGSIPLSSAQAHHLRAVLRLDAGASVRLFNGRDGEWRARLESLGKKAATALPEEQIVAQPRALPIMHLLFAPPAKKHRMDVLIEKAVELGVSDFHPVITAHTQGHKLKEERTQAQIIEAAEQCERLDVPRLHKAQDLKAALARWAEPFPIYWGAERFKDAPPLAEVCDAQAFLIGPEGGFSDEECAFLSAESQIKPISLGSRILRVETAAITCLSYAMLLRERKK